MPVLILLLLTFSPLLMSQDTSKTKDAEIRLLKEKLHKTQIEEANKEVDGQSLMIGNWRGYAENIEQVKQLDQKDRTLQKQIHQLEENQTDLPKQ